jgi:hypothetical protein
MEQKRLGVSVAVVSSQTNYQEWACGSGCSRNYPSDIAPWRQGCLRNMRTAAAQISERHVQRLVAEPDSDDVRRNNLGQSPDRRQFIQDDGFGGDLVQIELMYRSSSCLMANCPEYRELIWQPNGRRF